MRSRLVLALLAAVIVCVAQAATAAERRIALVIGESAYEGKPIETAANDAGLIAQTLQSAGFDVSGARDLDEELLRGSLRDFLEKARNVGPDGVAFIYFAGAGAQLEGDNYLLPVGAPITRDADIPLHGVRLSDYMKPLASMGLKTAVIVLDAARALPFSLEGQPIAGGLALYDPGPSLLLAFNAAPGTIALQEPGPYGVYAQALAEMIRAGGLPVAQVFDQTRLRVVERTNGAQIPWNSQGFDTPFLFFERTAQAPARGVDEAALRSKPIAQFSAQDAFAAAVARDTLQSYQEFLVAYPDDPLAHRVRAILAARREALFWRKARMLNTPASYWTYLNRYPHGPHAWDARRLLAILASPPEPPPAFAPIDIGYPPPPPPEIVFVSRPVVFFGDPAWNFAPPPPPPPFFLPPPPPDFVVLPPPVVVGLGPYGLPVPPFVPVPLYVQPPAFVAPPPGNIYFANIHNSVVVDVNQNVVIANPQGHVLSTSPIAAGAIAGAAGAAIGATLPRFIANRAAVQPGAAVAPGQGAPAQGQLAPHQGQVPPAQGQAAPQQGLTQPAPGHGLPAQAPASGAQQPFQGSHALPQPNAAVLQGQGAAPHGQAPQAVGQAPQNPGGPHDQVQPQLQPSAAAPKTQPAESQPSPGQGAKAHGHQDHGHASRTQSQPSPAAPRTQLESHPAQAQQGQGHQDHGHASQPQAQHGPGPAPQAAPQQSHAHAAPPTPMQNSRGPGGAGPQPHAQSPKPATPAAPSKPKPHDHDHHDHH